MLIELDNQDPIRLERHVLISVLGILHGLHEGLWTPDDAEAIVFKPSVLESLQKQGISAPVLDLIQQGFFLDDVLQHLGPAALRTKIDQMQEEATALLQAWQANWTSET